MDEGIYFIIRHAINVALVTGTLWVLKDLLRAARIVATPPFKEAQHILAGIRDIQHGVEALNSQLKRLNANHQSTSCNHDEDMPLN
jgi:hypothetical protein